MPAIGIAKELEQVMVSAELRVSFRADLLCLRES
jgi:hypothetical protein